jgi:fructoselysine 6-phosphate deglycase
MTEPIPEKRSANTFDSWDFIRQFEGALAGLDEASQLGTALVGRGIERLFFVGCGAPHFMMRLLEYWAKRYAISLDIRSYFSAEFIHQDPRALDQHTLVVFGSHSGKTVETVAAAEYLASKTCTSVAITQQVDSPLGSSVDQVITYGSTEQGYFSSYMLGQAFVSAIFDKLEPGWGYHDLIISSLSLLPAALAEAKAANLTIAATQAEAFADDRLLYVIGAGPMFTTAYTFASCFLMEMQRMHAHPLVAAEFFHGPIEIVDETTPLLLLVGEDPNRPEAERVVRFCERYARRYMVYDSKDYRMMEIPSEVRPIFSPFVVDAALTSLVEQLAVVHQHPLTLRRYMGKVEY